jgi:uncharacterized protein
MVPMHQFEYHAAKSAANRAKHGIDFQEAQRLWQDELRIETPAGSWVERRWLVVGVIDKVHWSAVVTYRDGVTRLISVRRARIEEVRRYEDGGT